MPGFYGIRPDLPCVFIPIEGAVTDAELVEEKQMLFADASFQGHKARLIDASNCERRAIYGDSLYTLGSTMICKPPIVLRPERGGNDSSSMFIAA